MRLLTLLLPVLVGCGLAPRVETMTPADIRAKVKVEQSQFEKATVYVGMKLSTDFFSSGIYTGYLLRSFVTPGEATPVHQLYVSRLYDASNWVFYDKAADDTATLRKVTGIDRQVGSCNATLGTCTYSETVGVEFPDDFLRAKAATGFQVRLSASNGSGAFVLNLPANYIQGHLAALPQSRTP